MEYPYAKQYKWYVRKKTMLATFMLIGLSSLLFMIPDLPRNATNLQILPWLLFLAGPMLVLGMTGITGAILGLVATVKVMLDDDPTDPDP